MSCLFCFVSGDEKRRKGQTYRMRLIVYHVVRICRKCLWSWKKASACFWSLRMFLFWTWGRQLRSSIHNRKWAAYLGHLWSSFTDGVLGVLFCFVLFSSPTRYLVQLLGGVQYDFLPLFYLCLLFFPFAIIGLFVNLTALLIHRSEYD